VRLTFQRAHAGAAGGTRARDRAREREAALAMIADMQKTKRSQHDIDTAVPAVCTVSLAKTHSNLPFDPGSDLFML